MAHNLAGTAQDNTWIYARNQAQEITSRAWSNNAYQWTGYAGAPKAIPPTDSTDHQVGTGVGNTGGRT